METLKCAICEQEGLIDAPGTANIKEKHIVCINETFTHWKVGPAHFFTKTQHSVREELKETISSKTGMLILN